MSERYEVSYWNERDRANLTLRDNDLDREIFSLWDDDFRSAIEDGFLKPPRVPRPNDKDWLDPALAYAEERGMLSKTRVKFSLDDAPEPEFDGLDVEVLPVRYSDSQSIGLKLIDENGGELFMITANRRVAEGTIAVTEEQPWIAIFLKENGIIEGEVLRTVAGSDVYHLTKDAADAFERMAGPKARKVKP